MLQLVTMVHSQISSTNVYRIKMCICDVKIQLGLGSPTTKPMSIRFHVLCVRLNVMATLYACTMHTLNILQTSAEYQKRKHEFRAQHIRTSATRATPTCAYTYIVYVVVVHSHFPANNRDMFQQQQQALTVWPRSVTLATRPRGRVRVPYHPMPIDPTLALLCTSCHPHVPVSAYVLCSEMPPVHFGSIFESVHRETREYDDEDAHPYIRHAFRIE